MADKKITELTNITGTSIADADEFVVVDASADETKAITAAELRTAIGNSNFNVNGNITLASTAPQVFFNETDSSANHRIIASGGVLYVQAGDSDGTNDGNLYLTGYTGDPLYLLEVRSATHKFGDGTTEFARINSTGVGIGTTSPDTYLHVDGGLVDNVAHFHSDDNSVYIAFSDDTTSNWYSQGIGTSGDDVRLKTNNTARLTVDVNGNVGIGTTSPSTTLEAYGGATDTIISVKTNTNGQSTFDGSGAGVQLIAGGMNTTSKYTPSLQFGSYDDQLSPNPKMLASIVGRARETYGASTDGGMALDFFTTQNDAGSGQQAVHAMTIDHDGQVGIGNTSPGSKLHVSGNIVSDSGTGSSYIFVGPRSTPDTGLPTGNVSGDTGVNLWSIGIVDAAAYSNNPMRLNRMGSDGNIAVFFAQGNAEGIISVSGTTVSYNGGHLARWSRLLDDSMDTTIVKGTVMTNLDEMVVWHHEAQPATYYEEGDELPVVTEATYYEEGDDLPLVTAETYYEEGDEIPEGKAVGDVKTEAVYAQIGDIKTEAVYAQIGDEKTPAKDAYTEENEQLNKMAVSSVEGDPNVAGVFVNWDQDDDEFNDMNIAMTGDMVIRIAQGTTVERGDLLMSAGDGTAKPQGDDIVRSKTIAKVTSTNVSHTYDDGSYLVPCVLMAC